MNVELHRSKNACAESESKPPTPSPRRWLQFSIRGMLIFTAVFGVTFGTFMHGVRTQQRAVSVIRQLGGEVEYKTGWFGRNMPERMAKYLGEDVCANVVAVTLESSFSDQGFHRPTVDCLDDMVDAVSRLPHVTRVALALSDFKDADLVKLDPLKHQIEYLSIDALLGDSLQGSKLEPLTDWPQLRRLRLLSEQLNETLDFSSLAAIPNLTQLEIGPAALNDEAFREISKITSLEVLGLFSCTFEGDSLRYLQSVPSLREVCLARTAPDLSLGASMGDAPDGGSSSGNLRFRFRSMWDRAPSDELKGSYENWLKEILPGVTVSQKVPSWALPPRPSAGGIF